MMMAPIKEVCTRKKAFLLYRFYDSFNPSRNTEKSIVVCYFSMIDDSNKRGKRLVFWMVLNRQQKSSNRRDEARLQVYAQMERTTVLCMYGEKKATEERDGHSASSVCTTLYNAGGFIESWPENLVVQGLYVWKDKRKIRKPTNSTRKANFKTIEISTRRERTVAVRSPAARATGTP